MMTLTDAAGFFNDQVFTDVFSSATFSGQVLPFPDSVRSGSSTRRRILDVAPGIVMPNQRLVTTAGQVYIVADANLDFFHGETIREKYPILPVDNQYTLCTVGQLLAGSGGTTGVYVSPSYFRRLTFEDQSEYSAGFSLYLSSYYQIPAGGVVYGNGEYYRTREISRIDSIGLGVAEAAELVDPVSAVTIQMYSQSHDPVLDSYPALTPVTNVPVLTEHISLDFQHESLGFTEVRAGDKAISILKSAADVNINDLIGKYKVLSKTDLDTWNTCHCRRVS